MKLKVLKLSNELTDRATGLTGKLTHWCLGMNHVPLYLFQPRGINKETGQPLKKIALEAGRFETTEADFEEVEAPVEVIGTEVTDKSSGYKGMAIECTMHPNGCFHLRVQPKGVIEKSGEPIGSHDFDIRELEGEKIPELTAEQLAESKKKKPSPTGDTLTRAVEDGGDPFGG